MKVLVVDDDPQMRSLVERILRGRCDLFLASNGEEGLEVARRVRLDVILTDNDMPNLNGIDMIRSIRAMPCRNLPRVILMTGSFAYRGGGMPYEPGVDCLLSKPFAPGNLLDLLGLQGGDLPC